MQSLPNATKQRKRTFSIEEYEEQQDENNGFCVACGEFTCGGCEPDARRYECEACGERQVYGLEECLLMDLVQ